MWTLYSNEYRNFKLARATMKSKQVWSEEDWRDELIGLYYRYARKQHKETPYAAIFISN
jgi:hypothetical protein